MRRLFDSSGFAAGGTKRAIAGGLLLGLVLAWLRHTEVLTYLSVASAIVGVIALAVVGAGIFPVDAVTPYTRSVMNLDGLPRGGAPAHRLFTKIAFAPYPVTQGRP